jgi:phospholipid/cholesterol/gamma-HCH transport system substrate-binding protein
MTQKISDERASGFDSAEPSVNSNADGWAGIFVLIAIILLLCGWMWLKSYSLMHPPQRFSVSFHNVAGLISNAAVNVNGVRVGSVEKLTLEGKDKVLVAVKVNGEDTSIPVGSQFDILSSGVVGAKYIEITLPQQNSDQKLPPLDEKTEVQGNDPVRIEVVVNKIAKQFDDFDFKEAHERVNEHMDTFARAADRIIVLTDKLTPAANHAAAVQTKIGDLATEMRGTSRRLNKFLDNPALTSDLKETAQKAKETAESIAKTMHELNQTLANKPLRSDLLAAMDNLNQSTVNIRRSVDSLQKITGDQSLRSDLKQIISSLNLTMDKADQMLTKPGFGTDMRGALGDVRDTIRHLDLAARQMNAILAQKHPLVHLIFGQPGSLKNADKVKAAVQSKQKIDKVIESVPSSSSPDSSLSPANSSATSGSTTNSSSSVSAETKTIENVNSEKSKKSAD